MTHYLIEFRFSGYAKKYLKELIFDVANKFNVKAVTRKRPVPHITLVGPLVTRNQKRLVREVKNIASKYGCHLVNFKLKGFGYFGNQLFRKRVIYVDVEASEELEEIRHQLVEKLKPFCQLTEFDSKSKYHFHATIAFNDIDKKFNEIWNYIKGKEQPEINQYLLRISVIKNQKILCEYDLMQERLLNRSQAKNKKIVRTTIESFKLKQEKLRKEDQERLD